MATIANLINKLWPSKNEDKRCLITGLDAAGKTTMLYKLKLGEVVTTIPTIGFNVETLDFPKKNIGGIIKLTCWDVGGCDKIRPLLRHYSTNTDLLIFMVDAHDHERLDESVHELKLMLDYVMAPHVPVLILANKQDLPNCIPTTKLFVAFNNACKGRLWNIYPTAMLRPMAETGLSQAFDWATTTLHDVAPQAEAGAEKQAAKEAADPRSAEALAEKFISYLARSENDTPLPEFLRQFKEYDLPTWDHYTHIRLAFSLLSIHGRQKGKDVIFKGIEDYIANSKQTTGRTFHVTMTYFWIQIVHFGMRAMLPLSGAVNKTVSDDAAPPQEPSLETIGNDFPRFLLLNPHVADGNLWADYYSKDKIMSPAAKEAMVLPDKKPLPSVLNRDHVRPKTS